MTALHLACAADEPYAPHAATTIHSVLANSGGLPVEVHLLVDERFPAAAADAIAAMVAEAGGSFRLHRIGPARTEGLAGWDYVSATMWLRIFLPELVPDVDRVLYLDDDAIAADSLEPLWSIDLGEHYVGAVTNVFAPHEAGRPRALGLHAPYFNSGVLLLNLARMREDGCTEALREYALAEHELDGYPDQDALNMVLGRRRLALHPRWNCMNSVMLFDEAEEVFGARAVAEARERPGIRHFEGPGDNKPWHLLCERPHRELYREHRGATPWPRVRPTGLTPANIVRRGTRALRRG